MNQHLRPPAVAGLFYPASATVLRRTVEALLEVPSETVNHALDRCPKLAIVPHAGYVYSGPIAASFYRRIIPFAAEIRRVVVLGPTHRAYVEGIAIPASSGFSTPLGDVAIDRAAIQLLQALPHVQTSESAHAQEHAIEVQLPFLQTVLTDLEFVPLAVGHATPETVSEVIERLWGGPETLILVSSDLSHYLAYDEARAIDTATARQIVALATDIRPQQACGAFPINGLLRSAKQHALQGQLLDLRNSGDTAGDKARVVGYGAFMFCTNPEDSTNHAN